MFLHEVADVLDRHHFESGPVRGNEFIMAIGVGGEALDGDVRS